MSMKEMFLSSSPTKRLKDFAIYVVVSMAVVVSIITAAVEGIPEQKFMPWFGFSLFTLLLFGQFVLKSRSVGERRSFWLVTGLSLLTHVITFTKLLHAGWQISGGEWVLLVLAEMALLIALRRVL